ncbi:MAG: circularly permuted type 2 ATP-grasp protein [Alphaproteobacteria bacterium]|nr:MAG: circularly permuted type 2 ATP-grasp protein [Alphaproteobacteria bacterium]
MHQYRANPPGSARLEQALMTGFVLDGYDPQGFYCEMLRCAATAALRQRLDHLPLADFQRRTAAAAQALYDYGITFTLYSESSAIDRILPFDPIPRVLAADEWRQIERGIIQRVTALNLLLDDVYHGQKILKDGVIPPDLILGNPNYRPSMHGAAVAHKAYVNICVLRAFPDLVDGIGLRPVEDYGSRLVAAMREIAPASSSEPQIVLLSPGIYNSAYFEHVFLAREMGVPLVQGSDLVIEQDRVYMRTIAGLHAVDVIYRRINDDFLDPEAFRPDSLLGVPGLMRAYNAGNVALANAVGTGVADDKAVYAYVPKIIRYYLGEDAILQNVETHICREPNSLRYTLDHLAELVVKPVGEAGGYGITIGPKASRAELEECRAKLVADPANYISQPCIDLSVAPTLCDGGVMPRHVDLRPFAITGKSTWVLPGGLTRVALRPGSLMVNSSQGGGSKDTWVLEQGLE